ncbi:MAG: 3-oxoacid CoA-transferase [Flavobacteriales bacterium]|nr:3-oxoacid CoA-transferase [Flavobacteriales bacterium]|tara:strand:+ start:3830 stop:4477 length:648 start_codon:yes stop_codon:yes gene_type:complete
MLEQVGWDRIEMAKKVALDIPDKSYVNLGIGIPELVADFIPKEREVIYQTENGLLGMGRVADKKNEDRELVNAGKKCVTTISGASFFHHADSFAMIRGGHIDICVLGAMQVSSNGDLANWSTGSNSIVPAVGGAMDLVAGVKKIFVITQHNTKKGLPKILEKCTFPLTGKNVVDRIYTNLAILDVNKEGLFVKELADNISFEYLKSKTEANLFQY